MSLMGIQKERKGPPEKATRVLSEGEIMTWKGNSQPKLLPSTLLLKPTAHKRASSPERDLGEMGLLVGGGVG
ncbi:hypothetical protein OIU84_014354 [Salix udensis]|uniref:Uncharacterized protein n=1 Tax=Salix udensis TaxID=889485 RepID=A0AAD6JCQ1_9ROSI|nr:hypothetical protein OIU84_014354 [Salix udensis]